MSSQETMKAWAMPIRTEDEVPAGFRDYFATLRRDAPEFPCTILTPSYEGFMFRTTPKLVCNIDDKIYVIEKTRRGVSATCYLIPDINYVEVGSVLLKSWIKLSGLTANGLAATSFKFSATTLHLFLPILNKIRQAATPTAPAANLHAEVAKFRYLERLNYKFMNYARRSIMPGETVISSVLQPDIRVKLAELFRRPFFRTVATSHISILTDRELIIIRDNDERWVDNVSYGGVWYYIPLNKIEALDLTEQNSETLALSIRLPANDSIRSLFSIANRDNVGALVEQAGHLTATTRMAVT